MSVREQDYRGIRIAVDGAGKKKKGKEKKKKKKGKEGRPWPCHQRSASTLA